MRRVTLLVRIGLALGRVCEVETRACACRRLEAAVRARREFVARLRTRPGR